MRQFAALMLLLTGCTATPPYAPASAGAASEPAPLWTGRGSAAGRAGIRACLDRVSNWVIIDDWESEMKVALSWLHANGPADDVDVAQRAWEASMLADVSVYMNMYEGGSHVGLVGSIARAEAVMDRVVFLEKLRRQIETE